MSQTVPRRRQVSVGLSEPLMQALSEEATKQERSMSYVAERAIRAYLKLGDPKSVEQDRQVITAAQAEAIARFTLPGNIGAASGPAQPADPPSKWDLDGVPAHIEAPQLVPVGPASETTSMEIFPSERRAPSVIVKKLEFVDWEAPKDELPVGMARNLKGLPE